MDVEKRLSYMAGGPLGACRSIQVWAVKKGEECHPWRGITGGGPTGGAKN